MSKPGITPSPGKKPQTRHISLRSAVYALSGPEPDQPVYKFSNRVFLEKPKHNPFSGL